MRLPCSNSKVVNRSCLYVVESQIKRETMTKRNRMDPATVSIEIPFALYSRVEALAVEVETDPENLIATLVEVGCQRSVWLRDLQELQEQIKRDGGLRVGKSREEVVEQVRRTRTEIFDAEYAHLYR